MYYVASNGIKTVVIERDDEPMNPRTEYDNLSKMVCWHGSYRLGDNHNCADPADFVRELADEYLSLFEIISAIKSGKLRDVHLIENGDGFVIETKNMSYSKESGISNFSQAWEETGYRLDKDLNVLEGNDLEQVKDDLLSEAYTSEILNLLNESENLAILPLYLYDHGGISMSTGSFVGKAPHAEWDSGIVGYIYIDKETALKDLCGVKDDIRIAKEINNPEIFDFLVPEEKKYQPSEELLKIAGFSQVKPEHLPNDENHELYQKLAVSEKLFKRNHKLYVYDGLHPWKAKEGTLTASLHELATYNPEIEPLKEENWKERAFEVLEAEVKEYDNYLTGEVYGYRLFEGLEETDSCWGFNPGIEDITTCMKEELSGWFGPGMNFEVDFSGSRFDIDEFFEERHFSKVSEEIKTYVLDYLSAVEAESTVYPFNYSPEEIRNESNVILSNIVHELYEEHVLPTPERIHEALKEHAGVAREALPKITTGDLEPGREYTASEVMEILNKKPSLADIIAGAEKRCENKDKAETKNINLSR